MLDQMNELMIKQFACEPARYGDEYDPRDELARTWHAKRVGRTVVCRVAH